jgi:EH domain-containing protein 2
MLMEEVPKLMSMIPQEEHAYLNLNSQTSNDGHPSQGNTIFNDQQETPFEIGGIEGINAGLGEQDWIVERSRHEYDQVFSQLSPQNGKISGAAAKQEMIKSKLVKKTFFVEGKNYFFYFLAK